MTSEGDAAGGETALPWTFHPSFHAYQVREKGGLSGAAREGKKEEWDLPLKDDGRSPTLSTRAYLCAAPQRQTTGLYAYAYE